MHNVLHTAQRELDCGYPWGPSKVYLTSRRLVLSALRLEKLPRLAPPVIRNAELYAPEWAGDLRSGGGRAVAELRD